MRIGFLVNEVAGVVRAQTTTLLIAGAAARGHETFVLGVNDLSWSARDRVTGRARAADPEAADPSAALSSFQQAPAEIIDLSALDVLVFRTNPARDPEHQAAHLASLEFGRIVRDAGVLVVNDPDGLARSASKLYLQTMPPSVRPVTFVGADAKSLIEFIHSTDGPVVVKPLRGTRGTDVLLVQRPDRPSVRGLGPVTSIDEALARLLPGGYVVAQEYLPEAVSGDVRLFLLNGIPLTVEGIPAAIRRVPPPGDFRSNLHTGGHPEPVELDGPMLEVASLVGPRLAADGIFFAGLDLIGGKAVEINTHSPGGLGSAGDLSGRDFAGAVLDWIESMSGPSRV